MISSLACNKITSPIEDVEAHKEYGTKVVPCFPEYHLDAEFIFKNRNLEFKIKAIVDTANNNQNQNFLLAIDYKNGNIDFGEDYDISKIPLTENQKLYVIQFQRTKKQISIMPYLGDESNYILVEKNNAINSITHNYPSKDKIVKIQIANAPLFKPTKNNVVPIGFATKYNALEKIILPADTTIEFKSGIYKNK